MNLIDIYSQQYSWRSWPTILDVLPSLEGQFVLDLGCGIGDLAGALAARGAKVLGIDFNEEVITWANQRCIPNAEFRQADLRSFHDPHIRADGIWSSFAAAYFPSFHEVLTLWLRHLRPGGWVALTEIDDFFGHHPVTNRTSELLALYTRDAIRQARYDFHMGRKLSAIAEQAGLTAIRQFAIPDSELSFAGRAAGDVRKAWADRMDQMRLLQEFCGTEFDSVRADFLNCLDRDDHYCTATVQCCIGFK